MGPPPVVTGVSPKEGPPGTRVTVRGEFLGTGPTDLQGLTICGCDCLLSAEWKSSNKIIARSGPGKGRGDIIVTTRSGGRGTSTVQFRGYHETIGPMKESAVWVEEAPLQTLAWGRRSLSPTSYQQEDPLGLSVEENDKKFPEDDLHELFPEGSGDLASEQFVAGWFLLEHHHATTFDDLRAGLAFLRRKVDGQKEGQLSFFKANVGSVMDQMDTLMILKDRFEADMKEHGPEPTVKVENAIQDCILEANKLFDEVLARRDRADATRNALGVLLRFKFLFSLPVSIERNIRKGDYDVVINDYARAKNLFSKTDVAVFKKVLVEVEQRINRLREILHSKLQDMPSTLEEQKRIIRNLVNLEATGDPAWDGISYHSSFISQQLNSCRDEHIAAEITAGEDTGKTSKSGLQSTPLSNKFGRSSNNNNNSSQSHDWLTSVPQRVLFVEELTDIVSNRFPDLWKLGQAYFSGELHVKVEPGKQAQFKRMVLTTIELFSGLLRAAVLPHTLDRMSVQRQTYGTWPSQGMEGVGPWLPHCLRYVRSTYSSFIRLDLPGEALDIIAILIFDLRLHCMSTLFQQASEHVKSLHKRETWKIEFDSKHGGITALPSQFESKVQEVVQLVKESVLVGEQRETSLLENSNAQRELSALVQGLLLSFSQSLENFAFSNEAVMQEDHSTAVSQLIGSPAVYRSSEKERSGPAWEQRLLTTLSNCQYTAKVVLPCLSELFIRHGFPSPVLPIATATNALNTLDKRILEVYLEQKSDPLVGTIEPSMYLGRFDWDTTRKPTDIRPYAKEIIANMIGVHAEVHRVSPNLVPRVLTQIVETVAEELSRLMSCVTRFSVEGNQQARADILAVQETVRFFITPTAQSFFDEALEAVPPLISTADMKVVEDILTKFRIRMRLQLMCFGDPKNQQTVAAPDM
ncbi:exocyst complex component 2 [Zootermopsis nevadensis]|uniref:Exocyst complex component 2 n=1 Tax=Zootermopsis nevadensis TaxID=136037 RepID=A0A067QEV0_ZOONE|nr:exocyst complex component 2 [Zootermopsis nevadensis]KDQ71568.1 Exocyst complex component 2 [Zootermopsis nevadensis]